MNASRPAGPARRLPLTAPMDETYEAALCGPSLTVTLHELPDAPNAAERWREALLLLLRAGRQDA
jgi:hypothetical protein